MPTGTSTVTLGRLAIALRRLAARVDALEADMAEAAIEACGDDDDREPADEIPADLLSILRGSQAHPDVERLVDNVRMLAGSPTELPKPAGGV